MMRNFSLNVAKFDVIGNFQKLFLNKDYSLSGELYASFKVGKKGKLNSGILIEEHPDDYNIKLMVIVDSSAYFPANDEDKNNKLLLKISEWFNSIDHLIFLDSNIIKTKLLSFISKLNEEVEKDKTFSSSLSIAVVCPRRTVLFNLGDCSIYAKKEKSVEPLMENAHFKELEIDSSIDNDIKVIENNDYDSLVMFSKSIFKNLSKKEIDEIVMNNPTEYISKELVEKSSLSRLHNKEHYLNYDDNVLVTETDAISLSYKRRKSKI